MYIKKKKKKRERREKREYFFVIKEMYILLHQNYKREERNGIQPSQYITLSYFHAKINLCHQRD